MSHGARRALAAKLEKVRERLEADAPNLERPGADLITYYLDPDRLPPDRCWSRKHAHTQRRLCERFAAPAIAMVTCQDIRAWHMQQIVNAAPTAGEGEGGRDDLGAGVRGHRRLKEVHWHAAGRTLPVPKVTTAGESALWVCPSDVPAAGDVERLGQALAAGRHGDRDELMANVAAYSGLRWGEIAALTVAQIDTAARVISVDRKVAEVAGHLHIEAPKNRKRRQTIYPGLTPSGYLLAERLAARTGQARTEQHVGSNPLGLFFPSPHGRLWRSSNFNRDVLKRAYATAGWRDETGRGEWTWHSLRHVFCATALFSWGLDAADVSRMAGHANVRITLDMYVGAVAGVLDRARQATA